MSDNIVKINEDFFRDSEEGIDLKFILNPELLDEYFYEKKNHHHICILKNHLADYNLFMQLINDYKENEICIREKQNNQACAGCHLNCVNIVHSEFNFATYFIVLNINIRQNYLDQLTKIRLLTKSLSLFKIEGSFLIYDFDKMNKIFRQWDLDLIQKVVSINKPVQNLNYLNEMNQYLDDFKIRVLSPESENDFIEPIKKYIVSKEQYINKKLAIDELSKSIDKKNEETPISDENDTINIRKTRSQIILEKLNEYGFSALEKLKKINTLDLIAHIFNDNTNSYKIAYLYHLGFIEHLKLNYFEAGTDMNKALSKMIGINPRDISGNLNVLNCEKSEENRKRYKADILLKDVIKHHQSIS